MADPQTSGVPDGWEVVQPSSPAASEPSKGHDFKLLGVNIHVPGEQKARPDSNIIGWGDQGAGIAPEDALAGGMVGKSIIGATKAGGMLAGAKDAITQASPIVKYELTKTTLTHMGVPEPAAMAAAMLVSGYKKGTKPTETPTPSAPDSPHLDLSTRVPAGGMTQQQIGERLAAARAQGMTAPRPEPQMAPRPSPSSVPVPPGPPEPSMPPEPFNAPRVVEKPPTPKQISEQALLEHRAVINAAREANVELKPGDREALVKVVRSGVSAKDAVEALKASRDPAAELAKRLGTPSDAEMTFPPNKSGLPSKPPTARKARGKLSDLADMP